MRVRIALLLSALLVAGDAGAQVVSSFLAPLNVARGGIGVNTCTAYLPIFAGITATGAFQCAVGAGTSGQVLTSNGAGVLPSWQAAAGGANPAGSGSEINARLNGTTFQAVTGSSTANGGTAYVIQDAAQVGLSLTGAAAQSANMLNVTSNGGSAGDLFKVSSGGATTTRSLTVLGVSGATRAVVDSTADAYIDVDKGGATDYGGYEFFTAAVRKYYILHFNDDTLHIARDGSNAGMVLDTTGRLLFTGTAPTVGGTCGTGPAVAGTNPALKITTGTGSPTSCAVTFSAAWATAPVCVANASTTTTALNVVTTTTTVTVSAVALTASETIHVHCLGY